MKTTFTLRLISENEKLAKEVAHTCIDLIDTIENTLSRYIPGSDAWRINHMQAGETIFLTEHCYNCLYAALEICAESNGLFDITLGRQIEHKKEQEEGPIPKLAGQLMLDPNRPAMHCIEAGREIDLGGIGKGYALDQIKEVIKDWGIKSALLSAGSSTQLAYGEKAWEVQLGEEHSNRAIILKNQAISSSGSSIQGSHIISPQKEHSHYLHNRLWVIESDATKADSWSTACLIMTPEELAMCKKQRDILTPLP